MKRILRTRVEGGSWSKQSGKCLKTSIAQSSSIIKALQRLLFDSVFHSLFLDKKKLFLNLFCLPLVLRGEALPLLPFLCQSS